jgi:hypothetical protein
MLACRNIRGQCRARLDRIAKRGDDAVMTSDLEQPSARLIDPRRTSASLGEERDHDGGRSFLDMLLSSRARRCL